MFKKINLPPMTKNLIAADANIWQIILTVFIFAVQNTAGMGMKE